MKTPIMLASVALLLIACQPKKETETNLTQLDLTSPISDMTITDAPSEIKAEAYAQAPIIKTVKFVPPIIKDDAVEESSPSGSKTSAIAKNKKIIKDGSISIRVKDVEAAKKRMDAIVKTHDGYYENESFENYDIRISYNLKVRVPSKKFESFLKASEKAKGEITSKNINARDVTEEYVDGETRLNSKRLFRTRYNQLLEKASKVDDILAIEENIRVLQEEIESHEGHLKFLDDQVSYSTLEITLFAEKNISKPAEVKESFLSRTKTSLTNGWEMLIKFVLWCVTQWPWYIAVIVVFISTKIYLKKRRK